MKKMEETMLVQRRQALMDLHAKIGMIHRLVVLIVVKEKTITAEILYPVQKKVLGVSQRMECRHAEFQCVALKVNVKQRITV
jgi:hypothetical protein